MGFVTMSARRAGKLCFLTLFLIAGAGSVLAQPTEVHNRNYTDPVQNTVLNMYISAIPELAGVQLKQTGVVNHALIFQLDFDALDLKHERWNFARVDQTGFFNNIVAMQVGTYNVAVFTQGADKVEYSYIGRTTFDFDKLASGYGLRFRSGNVDIISVLPGNMTAISTFGRPH